MVGVAKVDSDSGLIPVEFYPDAGQSGGVGEGSASRVCLNAFGILGEIPVRPLCPIYQLCTWLSGAGWVSGAADGLASAGVPRGRRRVAPPAVPRCPARWRRPLRRI